MGHEEPPVGPRSVPLQQDGPQDVQLGHEWVSGGLAMETGGVERSPAPPDVGVTVGEMQEALRRPHPKPLSGSLF